MAFALALAGALAGAVVLVGGSTQPGRAPASAELASTQNPAGLWSPPAALSRCPAEPATHVVFPSDRPAHGTGPGAIVWSASAACPGGPGARVAPIGAAERAGPSVVPRTAAGRALAPHGQLVASGGPRGQIVIGGAAGQASAGGRALLIQGSAGGPFSTLTPADGASAPLALATAYLGDVALTAPVAGTSDGGGDLRVQVERFFARGFAPGATVAAGQAGGRAGERTGGPAGGRGSGRSPIQTPVAALDYRSEVLVAWVQGGSIYARLVSADGVPEAVQRLAPAGTETHLTALLSDDRRGMVAWSEQRGGERYVYIDRSGLGVRFHKPELLERFLGPHDLPAPAASPTLVRLSSESVMLAWAGASAGHWVVRVAQVDLSGVGAVTTIAPAGADALLADLVPGPVDDALVLWTEPLADAGGTPDLARQAIYAAAGLNFYPPARAVFGAAEMLAPPGHVSDATVAFDPDTDAAVAAWQGEAGAVEYSVRK